MLETIIIIIKAIKLLEKRNAEAAEFLLRQELNNINHKFLIGLVSCKDIMGTPEISTLLEEFNQYLKDSGPE